MNRLFLLFLLFPSIIYAQITENWINNNLTNLNNWQGTVSEFKVDTILNQLKLNAPAETSDAYLSCNSLSINNASWNFSVQMDFNPSSANYTKIYLTANNPDLTICNGYFVMLGGSNDEISLWKTINGKNTKIIDGEDGKLSESSVLTHVLVQRDSLGNFKLYSKINEDDYLPEGEVFDNDILSSQYFGIYCKFTSTRSTKFSFGSIIVSGGAYVDNIKPRILSHQVYAGKQLDIKFSEAIDTTSISTNNFTLVSENTHPTKLTINNHTVNIKFDEYLPNDNYGNIKVSGIEDLATNSIKDTILTYSFNRICLDRAKISSNKLIQLSFSKPIDINSADEIKIDNNNGYQFQYSSTLNDSTLLFSSSHKFIDNQELILTISNVVAEYGDIIKDTIITLSYHQPKRFDIIFSELMIDHTPSVGLPDAEFIELYNRTNHSINLENWTLSINDKSVTLPAYELNMDSFVIICHINKQYQWENSASVLGVENLPSMPNTGGTIILRNSEQLVCDAVNYPFNNLPNNYKSEGGWALERIDLNNLQSDNNWLYAENDNGGTPGALNSINKVNPDVQALYIKYISFINENCFEYAFSEPIDSSGINNSTILVNNVAIDSVLLEPVFLNKITIYLKENLKNQTIYNSRFAHTPKDLAGNLLMDNHSLRLGIPEPPDSFDVCINEVLFNPISEATDFVEIYNRSTKILNQNDLYTSSITYDLPDELFHINNYNQLLFPGDYLVITKDTGNLNSFYPNINTELLIESNLPSLNDDEGNLAITTNNGTTLDYFSYTDDMHFELLRDKEGVSLERINTNMPTNNTSNWHSASSACGYATPTLQNSQYSPTLLQHSKQYMWLEAKEFSPNSDSNEDYLQINYALNESGWSGTIKIFDKMGRPVKTICNNDLLASKGFYTWDGTTNTNTKAPVGIYIIYCELFSANGKVKTEKLMAVLTAGMK